MRLALKLAQRRPLNPQSIDRDEGRPEGSHYMTGHPSPNPKDSKVDSRYKCDRADDIVSAFFQCATRSHPVLIPSSTYTPTLTDDRALQDFGTRDDRRLRGRRHALISQCKTVNRCTRRQLRPRARSLGDSKIVESRKLCLSCREFR
jgi:hypothetical protein